MGLKQIVIHPEQLESTEKNDAEAIEDRERQLKALRTSRAKINQKIESAFDLLNDHTISKADFADRHGSLTRQKQAIEGEIPRLEGEISFLKVGQAGKSQLLDRATSLSAIWDTISLPDKGKIIKEIVSKIVVKKDSLHLELFYLPELMGPLSPVGKGDRNLKGSIVQRARLDSDVNPGVIFVDFGWWFPESGEAGLFSWDRANANILTDDAPPRARETGTPQRLRGILCTIAKAGE